MKRVKSVGSLLSYVDSIFMVEGEMKPQNGEDSYMFFLTDDYGIIGVFDGCGGLGSRKYAEYNGKTGAFIASRVVSNTVYNWFKKFSDNGGIYKYEDADRLCEEFKAIITNELKSYESNTRSSGIKGSMTRSFPTTVAMTVFYTVKDLLYATYIWAGDSRGYVLTSSGLSQITTDDIESGGDALDNISNDSKLTNVVSADGGYALRQCSMICDEPSVIITATDGCFGYFNTPMDFEYMILECLKNAESVEAWSANMNKYIREYTGDDYTMGVVVCGYKNFKKMKKEFMLRYNDLLAKYMYPLRNATEEEKILLWNEYKKNYYRGV